MRAFVLLNGNAPSDKLLDKIKADDLVVCADGAYKYIEGRFFPDILLGDYDSLGVYPSSATAKRVLSYPVEKDFTDGHLAVEKAVEEGATELVIYGALGGRSDHFVSNLSLLYLAKKLGAKATIVSENENIYLIDGSVSFDLEIGTIVSMVPFFDSAHILSTEGLKYPANDVVLLRENSLGVSNEAIASNVKIVVEDKPVLLFITLLQGREE